LANTLKLVSNSIQLNRNLSMVDDGTIGPFSIQATQSSVSGTGNFNLLVSSTTAGTITTRALTEISGSSSVRAGSPFRCGVSFKKGDVPAGTSVNTVDGGGNILSAQIDAVNHWPDGSVRWCEMRGYTTRAIAPGGTDTLSFVRSASPFSNTLPNGKAPTQLLMDLQSFPGAQDLNIELSSMASCSGTSNVYTSGTWTAHFNALLAGSNVQQVNKGPCCMGFRAFGQLTNGANNHPHIMPIIYVWLWLNTSTGAIRDVEYIVYLHNSLLTQAPDGVLYSAVAPDRYNYNPAIKNGSTVIVNNSDPTMLLPAGGGGIRLTAPMNTGDTQASVSAIPNFSDWQVGKLVDVGNGVFDAPLVSGSTSTLLKFQYAWGGSQLPVGTKVIMLGGHYPRSGWWTARADMKPRFIGSIEATNLHVTIDPLQANPQTVTTARDYLCATGLLPHYDPSITDIVDVSATFSYQPMAKGGFVDGHDGTSIYYDYTTGITLNSGGNGPNLGMFTGFDIAHFFLQSPKLMRVARLNSLGWCTFPARFLDVNGRVPNTTGISITGLTAATNTSICDCSPSVEQIGQGHPNAATNFVLFTCGNYTMTPDTTHLPNHNAYAYLIEGGTHHRDVLAMTANDTMFWAQDYNEAHAGHVSQAGAIMGTNRGPVLAGIKRHANRACSVNIDREEAWMVREAVLAAALLPDNLADGTAYGETLSLKESLRNTIGYATDVIPTLPAAWQALGRQNFGGGYATNETTPNRPIPGWMEPWMQAYLGQAYARFAILHHDEPTMSANLATFVAFNRKHFENFVNTFCSIVATQQWMFQKIYDNTSAPNWRGWGDPVYPVGVGTGSTNIGGDLNTATFADTAVGWITFGNNQGVTSGGWFYYPMDVGVKFFFTQDGPGGPVGNPAPAPFTQETLYRVCALDIPGKRLKLCRDADATNTPIIPSSPQTNVVFALASLVSCPSSYTDYSDPARQTLYYSSANNPQAQIMGTFMAVRSYRAATDSAAMATADAALHARVTIFNGGTFPRNFYASSPNQYIKFP
jgi:hypothetical protein